MGDKTIKIALAQLNFCVGDIEGNTQKILTAIKRAKAKDAKLIVFSELALTGYPIEDLLFKEDLHLRVQHALTLIRKLTQNFYVIVGYPEKKGKKYFNVAEVIYDGKMIAKRYKYHLPNYSVFDEKRYFEKGEKSCVFDFRGIKTGLLICEDLWFPELSKKAVALGAKWLICISASPYDDKKFQKRIEILKSRISENSVPVVYVNLVGGQDEVVFDGRSFVMNEHQEVCAQGKHCQEDLLFLEMHAGKSVKIKKEKLPKVLSKEEEIYSALVLATRDYVMKNGFSSVYLGVSGGIDSALTLAIAVDALGPKHVTAIVMPSRYTALMSMEDAYALAGALKVKVIEIPITPMFNEFLKNLKKALAKKPKDITEKNIQARVRAVLLMALANEFNGLVLTTSNKSEIAAGYSTLYGDMAGGFDVLKDVYKTMIYRLAAYRNQLKFVIPKRTITCAPTAELAPNQKDQDDLPPYDTLDIILKLFIEENLSEEKIIQKGFDESLVKEILTLLKRCEYKRRQSPIGPRMTTCSFGKDWRFPVSGKK